MNKKQIVSICFHLFVPEDEFSRIAVYGVLTLSKTQTKIASF